MHMRSLCTGLHFLSSLSELLCAAFGANLLGGRYVPASMNSAFGRNFQLHKQGIAVCTYLEYQCGQNSSGDCRRNAEMRPLGA